MSYVVNGLAVRFVLAVSLLSTLPGLAWGRELTAQPKTLKPLLAKLKAGDHLRLAAGVYEGGWRLKGLHGQPGARIVIEGLGEKTVIRARQGVNSVELTDCSYLTLKRLSFDGRGLSGIDAIKAGGRSAAGVHHINIVENHIKDHCGSQQTVGISTKLPAWNWVIRGNTLVNTGTGLYLGNSNGQAAFVAGLIEYNYVAQPVGYCMQIKHQRPRPKLTGMPAGASRTVIRYNIFSKDKRQSPDGDRPNLLVGGFPDSGPGKDDRYEIYGNVFHNNPRESLLQGTGRLTVHDNLFIGQARTGVRIQAHHGKKPKLIHIYHNTFYDTDKPWSLVKLGGAEQCVVSNLVAHSRKRLSVSAGNVALAAGQLKLFKRAGRDFGSFDWTPKRTINASAVKGLKKRVRADLDAGLDFYGQKKSSFRHCGAILKSRSKLRLLEAKPRTEVEGATVIPLKKNRDKTGR